jgi:hypothetical protein
MYPSLELIQHWPGRSKYLCRMPDVRLSDLHVDRIVVRDDHRAKASAKIKRVAFLTSEGEAIFFEDTAQPLQETRVMRRLGLGAG